MHYDFVNNNSDCCIIEYFSVKKTIMLTVWEKNSYEVSGWVYKNCF